MKFRHEAVLDASQRVARAVRERCQPAFRYPEFSDALALELGRPPAHDAGSIR